MKKLRNVNKTKKLLSYDEWLETLPTTEKYKDIFNKDLDYKDYFYMQTKEDKEYELRELWIKTRKQRLETSMSLKHKTEFASLNKEISDLIRSLRRQIDKYLVKNSLSPHFGNYIRFYDKEELLFDAEINFYQIKKFLNLKTSILQKDESIAKDYLDLMSYITRKKLMENSIAKFEKPQFYSQTEEEKEKLADIDDDLEEIKPLKKMTSAEYSDLFTFEESEEIDSKTKEKRLKDKLISHFEDQLKQAYGKQLQQEKSEDRQKEKEANKGKKKQQLKGKEVKKDKDLKKKDKKDKGKKK